ncbi:MAG TPA: MFS transporter [Longimicrobiaceae bacterium]|nr:MFS transporter [Longimicrobiaceae bacterium]
MHIPRDQAPRRPHITRNGGTSPLNRAARSKAGWLETLGLHRPELRAWVMYDWANSAMVTTVVAAVFPIYYYSVAGAGLPEGVATFRFSVATTIALAFVAVLAPILGAIADFTAAKKRMLAGFLCLGVGSVGGMFFIGQGEWLLASVLFVFANIGAGASFVFYDSLLPHIAAPDEMDRVSTAGYAIGYLGGGILLAFNLAWISAPGLFGLPTGPDLSSAEATLPARLALLSVAVWWLLFSIPFFRGVPEPPRTLEPDESRRDRALRVAFTRLGETFRELRGYKQAFLMLIAFLVYNDGIGTIIKMATIYGTEIGIGQNSMILAILIVQFVGVPFSFAFGSVAGRIGAKKAIFGGLAVYAGISILGYFMTTATHFLILAGLVGVVQGGTQALSRSLFASMIPRHKSGEFFGFFAVFEKFAGIFGPAIFALTIALTGSSRNAILSIILFFIGGALLLAMVDVDEGRRVAQEAEKGVRPVEESSLA